MRFVFITIVLFLVDLLALKLWIVAPAEYLQSYDEAKVKAVGYIEPLSIKENEQSESFILNCEEIWVEGKAVKYKEKLRVYMPKNGKSNKENYDNDQKSETLKVYNTVPLVGKIEIQGTLHKLHNFANPGAFSMENYNQVQGIGGMIRGRELILLDDKPRFLDYFVLMNIKLKKQIKKLLPTDNANVLIGMILGGSNEINVEIRESFAANGLSHLLSVSGTHLLLLASFLRMFLKALKRRWSNTVLLLLLSIYAIICGLKPPVLRALGMSAILLWGDGEKADKGKVLCVLCMMFIICNPVCILDLGFQLSFGATAGLIWLLEPLKRKLGRIFEFSNTVKESIAVTLAAQLATLPILVGNFYVVSVISIFSNLLLVPILEATTIITIIGTMTSFIFVPLGQLNLNCAGWLVEQVLKLASLMQTLPFSSFIVGEIPLFCAVLYYAVLFSWLDLGCFLSLNKCQKRWLIGLGSFVIVCFIVVKQYMFGSMTIYFADVGQGDCAIIISPQKKVAIIDTGGLKNFDTGARIIVPLLRSQGIGKVDMLFISHGDFDHIGGGAGLARNMPIDNIILPQEQFRTDEIITINKLLRCSRQSKISYAQNGQSYELGGAILRIKAALEDAGNDGSSIIELEDRRTKYKALFTGDMSTKGEEKLEILEPYDLLKVAHHGAKSSSSEEFLQQVQPKLAIISCGYKNLYGHPHRDTLARLNRIGCTVLRTDNCGCIQVQFEEEGIKVKKWRKEK